MLGSLFPNLVRDAAPIKFCEIDSSVRFFEGGTVRTGKIVAIETIDGVGTVTIQAGGTDTSPIKLPMAGVFPASA
ncbi:hypothetical protein A0H81_13446 [Grifola frondosa]|uniref:Uncharacterized protein n=1 Tax=Grifola frondosa TaxID=5627 RepID=A0A1C7LPP5_GRIFR|nr:hypothetical protein A0H81_13446 [Grifola frondosa]